MRWRTTTIVTVLTSLSLYLSIALAATTGQIKGRIIGKDTGNPVIGASVLVVGTTQGAMTDLDGNFQILRLKPGKYTLRVSHLEFVTVEITDVEVEVDSTTEVNQSMTAKVTDLDETITVLGTPDILDKFVVEGRVTITGETIKQRPVQTVDNLLEQVAGVRTTAEGEVFVRGGRTGEATYIVDGKPVGRLLSKGSYVCRLASPSNPPPAHGGTVIVNGEPFDAMFFKHSGVNPFVDTEDDHLSTFAVDVDDAAYTMTRSYLERGHLPPEEAVRVEEIINHFDYEYPSPEQGVFGVTMEAAPSKFGPVNSLLLRIGIKGREVSPEDRKSANLVFVIDVSGSMNRENRLELVKKSLLMLVKHLRSDDRVGIVIYGSDARVLLNPTWAGERQTIVSAIKALQPGGSTYAEKGIRLGYEMAASVYGSGKINRIILCSDGVANVGITKADDILKVIEKHAQRGITITTVGFGMGNYNDILMERLGNRGNGFYAYIDDIGEARRLFADNVVATLQVIARDVKIQVDFNPAVVRSYRLLGYENRDVDDDRFRDDDEDGGEIGPGHSCTALYELKLHARPVSQKLATVFIRHKETADGSAEENSYPFYLGALTESFEKSSEDFQLAAAAAEFAEILRDSYWARNSELEKVKAVAEAVFELTGKKEVEEFVSLISKAAQHGDQLADR